MDDDEHVVPESKEPSPIERALIAIALGATGLFCLAVGFHWVSAQPSPGVPRGIVALVGVVLTLGCVVVLLPRNSQASAVLAALMISCFAAVGGWIALGPGERTFGMSWSFGLFGSAGDAGEWIGRMAFGFGALMCAAFAFLMWRRALRPPPPAEDTEPR